MTTQRRLTTGDVAAALGLRPATIQKYAREGRIPFAATPGGHRRYDIDEVRGALGLRSERGRGSVDESGEDISQIRAHVRRTPAERLQYLMDLLAFEHAAHRAHPVRGTHRGQ